MIEPQQETHDNQYRIPRVCLGMEAPAEVAEFLRCAGVEVLPFGQKQHASLYVDFVGAQPSGVPLLSIQLAPAGTRQTRPHAHLVTDNPLTAGCLIISRLLRLQPPLLTADPAMLDVVRTALSAAPSPVPVIISGEIGLGKAVLARLIHTASRRQGPFVTLNCVTLDSERACGDGSGALTTADWSAAMARVGNGTMFLDEIGELSAQAQSRLLQVLEVNASALWMVGGMPAGVRVIGATNRRLLELMMRGEFRKDLFWQLSVFTLEIPPLRQRPADVALLARHFLRQANPRRTLSPMALRLLSNYPFPGNIRELHNLIARLAVMPLAKAGQTIDAPDVHGQLAIGHGASETPTGWKVSREEARREMVLRAIAACGGNRAEAARKLGITIRALQYHITKAGLSRRHSTRRLAHTTPPNAGGSSGNNVGHAAELSR